jgi:hypothetical protein
VKIVCKHFCRFLLVSKYVCIETSNTIKGRTTKWKNILNLCFMENCLIFELEGRELLRNVCKYYGIIQIITTMEIYQELLR